MLRTRPRSLLPTLLALVLVLTGGLSVVAGAAPQSSSQNQGLGGPNFDSQAALNTLHRWALGFDERREELMRDAFTEDARFVFHLSTGGNPFVFEGIDEIMDLFLSSLEAQGDQQRRHVTTNAIVERVDRTTVRVTSLLTLFAIDDPREAPMLLSTGVYEDTLVFERDGVWRIQERILELDSPS